jgi:hypothetical protein
LLFAQASLDIDPPTLHFFTVTGMTGMSHHTQL